MGKKEVSFEWVGMTESPLGLPRKKIQGKLRHGVWEKGAPVLILKGAGTESVPIQGPLQKSVKIFNKKTNKKLKRAKQGHPQKHVGERENNASS